MWLGLQTVSSLERCPLFNVLYREVSLYGKARRKVKTSPDKIVIILGGFVRLGCFLVVAVGLPCLGEQPVVLGGGD